MCFENYNALLPRASPIDQAQQTLFLLANQFSLLVEWTNERTTISKRELLV